MKHQRQLALPQIVRAGIERSRRIAELDDDWDDEESPGYAGATVENAVNVAHNIIAALSPARRQQIASLDFVPGPEGSVDVELVLGNRRLLINVASDAEDPLLYYGYGPQRTSPIKGGVSQGARLRFLAEWLTA